ncbi:MAG: hypothetical protein Q8P95_04405 [bacterium]|nr:hypothetical protein [bacterium]
MKKLFALLFVLGTLTACGTREPGQYDKLAQCLTDKDVKMYGADTCPHCLAQKKAFMGSFDLINYVECRKDPQACEAAGITNYPTWIINGERHVGETSMSELAELSSCEL